MAIESVVIVNAVRTAVGKLSGSLSSFTAPELGAKVIEALIKMSEIKASQVDEVIMGNVISAGIGQNPARQASILGGLPESVAALTINKVCASGLKAVALGAQAIMLGEAKVVIAGGMESMSSAPFLLKEMRGGKKFGNSKVIDSLVFDGLWDCYNDLHMGSLCELTVDKYKISRKEQDEFAFQSHKKALSATNSGMFADEIVPIRVRKKNEEFVIDKDEGIRGDTNLEKLSSLKPVFKKEGTITAGNAPGLNDGAAGLLLMSAKEADRLKLQPMVEISGYATGHLNPKWYTIAPVKAIKTLLKNKGLTGDDFDLIELNEAFAAQAISVIKELSLDMGKININGGAIAIGHPIGASGARILVTLIHALKHEEKNMGLAALCLGGGGGMSMAVKLLNDH